MQLSDERFCMQKDFLTAPAALIPEHVKIVVASFLARRSAAMHWLKSKNQASQRVFI
ncbi:hypothetical protein [Comamonas kerstersii]|uniref:hypothetical protein n=1 Tax=Comamonas kerstersii TaxID=225992 RepID=UPI001B32A47B|nr:hypothetical protein [Comamonas kerstersii]QTW17609.1 hypothetical protein H8N02_10045 [Comamonas kerstersii]